MHTWIGVREAGVERHGKRKIYRRHTYTHTAMYNPYDSSGANIL